MLFTGCATFRRDPRPIRDGGPDAQVRQPLVPCVARGCCSRWRRGTESLRQRPGPGAGQGPDKEVAEKIAALKEVVADKKFARDAGGRRGDRQAVAEVAAPALEAKDQAAIVKALDGVFTGGKLRPHDKTELYVGGGAWRSATAAPTGRRC
jgi:hypothetical protein